MTTKRKRKPKTQREKFTAAYRRIGSARHDCAENPLRDFSWRIWQAAARATRAAREERKP